MPDPVDPNPPAPPPPPAITEEDVGRIVNQAVTSQLSRALPKALGDAIGGLKLEELVSAAIAKVKPPEPSDDDKSKIVQNPEVQKQLRELALKLEQSEKKFADSERARAEIERQRLYDSARGQLTNSLKEKAHTDYLDDWIRAVEPKLVVSDDGTISLKVKHTPFKGSPEVEEELPLDQAVPKLLERAEYKKYQAPPAPADGKGGTRGPRTTVVTKGSTTSNDPLDRVAARLAELGINFQEEFGGA